MPNENSLITDMGWALPSVMKGFLDTVKRKDPSNNGNKKCLVDFIHIHSRESTKSLAANFPSGNLSVTTDCYPRLVILR